MSSERSVVKFNVMHSGGLSVMHFVWVEAYFNLLVAFDKLVCPFSVTEESTSTSGCYLAKCHTLLLSSVKNYSYECVVKLKMLCKFVNQILPNKMVMH